jgi:hypothetical protein
MLGHLFIGLCIIAGLTFHSCIVSDAIRSTHSQCHAD